MSKTEAETPLISLGWIGSHWQNYLVSAVFADTSIKSCVMMLSFSAITPYV